MTDAQVDALAARMYAERAQERGPAWGQLGAVTRAVWRERALAVMFGDLA